MTPLDAYYQSLGFEPLGNQGSLPIVQRTNVWDDNDWALAFFASQGQLAFRSRAPLEKAEETGQDQVMNEWADRILRNAMEAFASDIHLEPQEDVLLVRYRLDGRLVNIEKLAKDRQNHLLAHLKIRSGLDIAEKRRPQDGRFFFEWQNKKTDLRVSTVPTHFGEKMVIRILDLSRIPLTFDHIGIQDRNLTILDRVIHSPFGMLLVTGPTGSGKTTTLYTILKTIQNASINIMTIEDPIEYQINGVNQTQVKPEIGVTFVSALRSFLRQDPNVIMVGEIRDSETAELATRAALTGHLVLSTLHTNNALGSVARLLDMGIPKHLLSSCLKLLMAQRLVRKLCEHCATPAEAGDFWPEAWGQQVPQKKPRGCGACYETGYRGRMGLYETIEIDQTLQNAIHSQASPQDLMELAKQSGWKSLLQMAIDQIQAGKTSVEEVLREVQSA